MGGSKDMKWVAFGAVAVSVTAFMWYRRAAVRTALASKPLSALLSDAFDGAVASKDVIPIAAGDPQLVTDAASGMSFIVSPRNSDAWKGKESAGGKDQAAKKPRDAFASIPERAILRGVCGTHNLILNKFPLVREHTVLITKQFVPQEGILSREDFCALWEVVNSVDGFAFYNSGPDSGASQPRRHLQIIPMAHLKTAARKLRKSGHLGAGPQALPVEALIAKHQSSHGWKVPVATPFELADFDFQHAVSLNGGDVTHAHGVDAAGKLESQYLALLQHVENDDDGELTPYNLLLTRNWMMVVNRSTEHWNGVSFNAVCFAGHCLMPEDAVPEFSKAPLKALQAVCLPKSSN